MNDNKPAETKPTEPAPIEKPTLRYTSEPVDDGMKVTTVHEGIEYNVTAETEAKAKAVLRAHIFND